MSNYQVPGIGAFPDLQRRFADRLASVAVDTCGGCKATELVQIFTELVAERLKRDNDFRKR